MVKQKQRSKIYSNERMDEARDLLNPATDQQEKWRHAADLAAEMNPEVKKEQDQQIRACAELRRLGVYKKTKSKELGLKLAVSIPPMTFNVLSLVDPSLRNIDKSNWLKKDGSNEIAQKLAATFPEYKVS